MSADADRIHGILDELVRQRRTLASSPGGRHLLSANGRAIAYWQRVLARQEAPAERGYTGHRSRM